MIENGLYNYMQNVISDIYSVFQMMKNNDESFRKKMYNFYDKNVIKHQKEQSEFSKVILADPLGEYKHVEKVDLEEHKIFENKLNTRDQKAEDDAKSTMTGNKADPSKKKKVIFDDVSPKYSKNLISPTFSMLKFTRFCTRTRWRDKRTMTILAKILRIRTNV